MHLRTQAGSTQQEHSECTAKLNRQSLFMSTTRASHYLSTVRFIVGLPPFVADLPTRSQPLKLVALYMGDRLSIIDSNKSCIVL